MTGGMIGLVLLRLLGRTILTQLAFYQLLVAKSYLYFTKGKTGSIPKEEIPKLDGTLRADHHSPVWTDQRVYSMEQLVKRLCNYTLYCRSDLERYPSLVHLIYHVVLNYYTSSLCNRLGPAFWYRGDSKRS